MQTRPTTVFAIGRWMPIHLGHKAFLVKLAKTYDRLVIGIGSCYENGTPRNCIPAIEREKLLRKILQTEGIHNAVIIPVQDRPTFQEWIDDVCRVFEKYGVTHFCTGNKEDILDVMDQLGIHPDVEMINPEEDSDFPYHATDIRNAILAGERDRLDSMIPAEIKPLVLRQITREIQAAARGEGQEFIPGRQTVDMVFTVYNQADQNNYLLIGKRNQQKIDFPGAWAIPGGGIQEFESPIQAAVRCFLAETGLDIVIEDNADEPARAKIRNLGDLKTNLYFTGIYASRDERINGTRGGGSQCFALHIDGDIQAIESVLHSTHDMDELLFINVNDLHTKTLAYDQKRMVYNALQHLGIAYDNGEILQSYDEECKPCREGVSRLDAHANGVLHGAAHTYIYKKDDGALYFLLQRRSRNKDSFPGCLDISSAGHIEFGSDFLSTAKKELQEELGLTVSDENLIELFTQTVDLRHEFRGKTFHDREWNKIYLLQTDLDPAALKLQAEEVSEAVWLAADDILQKLNANDSELCLNKEEFLKVLEKIKELNV